jgi:nucleoside-diphosphate-sugar epimerase
METVLVTGGAGFIGSNVVKLLLERKYKVKVLDNLSTGYLKNIENFDIEFIEGDIRDKSVVKQALNGVTKVFHLAAHIGNVKSLEFPFQDLEINATGTLTLLEAMKESRVEVLVYSSSAAIYGELKTEIVDETHPIEPESYYGVSKLAAEKYILAFSKLYGIKTVALRYFNVYGINQRYDSYGNVIPIFHQRVKEKKPLTIFGDGEQTRDFVNVIDVARANILAAENAKQSGFYNVGCGGKISINYLAQLLKEKVDFPLEIVYAPARKGEVIHCSADISKLQTDLGFEPSVAFEEGLRDYFEWFLKQ